MCSLQIGHDVGIYRTGLVAGKGLQPIYSNELLNETWRHPSINASQLVLSNSFTLDWTRLTFELEQLREAARKYPYHDAGTHGVWPRLVWKRRSESPARRLDDAVEFLGKWKALRFKGGGNAFRRICNNWLRKNLTDLRRLQGRVLYSLAPEDFQRILDIGSSFRDCGAPQTTYGKALHFFLPETVMLWDQAIVRNRYKLRPDPESFVSYQRFGWKLLHHVTRGKTVKPLRQLERDHAKSVGYFEPITMILDHLAFSPKLSARAVVALGGPLKAFSDDLS